MPRNGKYLILFLCFGMPACFFSQISDSLRKSVSTSRNPINVINTYVLIAKNCDNYDSAVVYINACIKFSEKQKITYGLAYASVSMCRFSGAFGHYEDGIKWAERGKEACAKSNNDSLMARAFINEGFMYYTMSNYDKATESYLNCLKYAEKCSDKKLIAGAYNVLGLTFATKKPIDHNKALYYYLKAEEIDKEIKSFRDLGFVYLRLGGVYVNMKQPEKARPYLDNALRIGDSIKDYDVQKWTLETYAGMYKQLKEYNKSLLLYSKALGLSAQVKDWPGIVSSSANLSGIYIKMGDAKNALVFADSSVRGCLAHKIYSALHHAFRCKSLAFEQTGDYKQALEWYRKSINVKDSIFTQENSQNLNELEKKYETEKKEKELAEKKSELLTQRADNEKQQTQRNFFIAGSVLLCGFLIFAVRGYRRKQKDNILIAAQKKEVENQKHIIEEKQKEVMDSITYAKRIQQAHLPNENYISKNLFELRKKI